MACSVCATNYGAWFTMSCGTRGIGAAGPRSPADITVLSLLSWFPWRPAWAWPISQIAAGAQLRSDRLGNVKKKQQKTTAERSRGVRSFDRPYDFWMPASCSRPSPLDNFSSGMSGDSVAGDRLRGSGSSESWLGGKERNRYRETTRRGRCPLADCCVCTGVNLTNTVDATRSSTSAAGHLTHVEFISSSPSEKYWLDKCWNS